MGQLIPVCGLEEKLMSGPNNHRNLLFIPALIVLALLSYSRQQAATNSAKRAQLQVFDQTRVAANLGDLPLSFEANQGQTERRVKFLARAGSYDLFLTATEAVLRLRAAEGERRNKDRAQISNSKSQTLRVKFAGANPAPQITGLDELPGKINYFIGDDPRRWRANVPTYAKVRYHNVYPGVDLVFYGNQRQLEYDLVVAPGADPGAIKFNLAGMGKPRIDAQGDLVLSGKGGELRLRKPVIYQATEQGRRSVAGRYVLEGNHQVGFAVAAYDATRPLVIDPVIVYSTYLGGSNAESFPGIAVDTLGSVYLVGDTLSADYPTVNPIQPPRGSRYVVVSKFNPTGSALVYSTYLGGSNNEQSASTANNGLGAGVAVDSSGSVYLTGFTNSNNFPTTANAFQSNLGGNQDVFLVKLNPAGSAILYSTYLGGSGSETARRVAVDNNGRAWIAGATDSTNFPTKNAAQLQNAGGADVFVTKFDTAQAGAASLVWSTYLGGSADDSQFSSLSNTAIAVDPAGNAYVAGSTRSVNFPVLNAFQPANHNAFTFEGFVTKFNATGALAYSTYLGGDANDHCFDIAVNAAGQAYVTGLTNSANFPLKNPLYATSIIQQGGEDGFITKLGADGSQLVFSTYLTGPAVGGSSRGQAIALGPDGSVYVTGRTMATSLQLKDPVQAAPGGNFDAFVTGLNNIGTALVLCTYLGGNLQESGAGIAVGSGGSVFISGRVQSLNFTTRNAFQPNLSGGQFDHFLTKISFPTSALSLVGIVPDRGGDTGLVTARIYGAGLSEGATVRLVKTGQPDILGSPGLVTDFGLFLTTTFDLRGKALGVYDLVVMNPDGNAVMLPGGFTVEAGGQMALYVKVVSRRSIRIGNEYYFYVLYGNRGNTDLLDVPVYISVPDYVQIRPAFDLPYQIGPAGARTLITLTVPKMAAFTAEESGVLPVVIKVANPLDAHRLFRMQASIGRPHITTSEQQFVGLDNSPPPPPGFDDGGGDTDPRTANDPNGKVGPGGVGQAQYVTGTLPLPYIVYFENLDTASLPAQDVVITDQLNTALLDLGTFSFGPIAFGDKLILPPPGLTLFTANVDLRPAKPIFVRVTAGLNPNTGLITWQFNTLDPATGMPPDDPLLGFLPPNVNSPEGQGSVLFTVKPKPNLASGTQISNQASIVFDVNAAINTPQWLNTIDNAKPASQVLALPSTQCNGFQLQWSGTDAQSGIFGYTIFVSDNGGPFVTFLSNTVATSAVFSGQFGHNYAFYSVAQDNVGNTEDAPATADTTTTIAVPSIAPTSQSFPANGGSGSVNVTAPTGCGWTATSNASFITITSGSSGTGDGTVGFAVAANPTTSERSGTITITGQTFNVLQAGAQPNPTPTLASLNPPSAISGSASLILTINGTNFVSGSVVRWNGSDRATTFVSGGQLRAQLLASDLATPGTGSVTVFNPLTGGGGTSNALTFAILSNFVSVSAASLTFGPVAPESIVAGFGVALAGTTQIAQTVPLPTTLGEVSVVIKDSGGTERNAPLFFVSPGQINFLTSTGTSAGTATITVFRANAVVGQGTLQIATVGPGVFTANSDGQGAPAGSALRVKADGMQVYENLFSYDETLKKFVPAQINLGLAGERVFLILYGTGIRFNSGLTGVMATLGGTPSPVSFAGAQGGFVGLDQVNLEVAGSFAGRGEVDAVLIVDGKMANTVKVNFK
jgi:uncharacterized protein (TIGR03437 family)